MGGVKWVGLQRGEWECRDMGGVLRGGSSLLLPPIATDLIKGNVQQFSLIN